MLKVFIAIFILSLLPAGVQASKRDARESLTPTKPYHLYMPSPFAPNFEGQKSQ